MRKTVGLLTTTACLFAAPSEKDRRQAAERLTEASTVLSELMTAGDKGIPRDLVEKAQCAVIVPGLKKGAFIVGAQFGKGFITCRGSGDRGGVLSRQLCPRSLGSRRRFAVRQGRCSADGADHRRARRHAATRRASYR